jgi:hypothetical protein
MDAATIARVMSVIPERAAWAHSGAAFAAHDGQGAQVKYLAPFLHWLSPLAGLTKDDQRALGLIATHQRPVDTDVELDEDAELAVDGELDAEDEAEDFDPDATLPPPPRREEEKTEVLV